MTTRPWSPQEEKTLRTLYAKHPASTCARLLGRTKSSVKNRIHALGLQKTHNTGHFSPGGTPWNKGRAGLNLGGKARRFQPGHKPHNWRPIGHTRERSDGYLERKVSDTGYTPQDYVSLHRLVWRLHGRTVPPGHILVFADGDHRNIDINNLQCIPRAELMQRNNVHNLPPEVKELVRLKARLVRKINHLEKHHD